MAAQKITHLTSPTRKVKRTIPSKKVALEAPWGTYLKELYNLFKFDPEVSVSSISFVSESICEATITSTNYNKLAALKKILYNEIVFGNVTLKITFDYNAPTDEDNSKAWRDAFEGNPLFDKIEGVKTPDGSTVNYAIFGRDIISFFNDDLSDYHGSKHMIVADIVKDVTSDKSVYPCTKTYDENA
jgi:hypothetical protein